MKIHKLVTVMLGFFCMVFISANNSYAEDPQDKPVHLSIPHSMNALITYGHCKVNSRVKDEKIVILSAIIEKEKSRVDTLFEQNKICSDNYATKDNQATKWKKEYKKRTKELLDEKAWPWWKFDFKSIGVSSIVTLIAMLLI